MPKMMVRSPEGDDVGIELDGDDWELGKYTTMDLVQSVLNYNNITKSVNNINYLVKIYYDKMKTGDITSILIFTITTLLLTMILFSFASLFPGQSNQDKLKKSHTHVEEEEKEPPRDFTLDQLRKFDGLNNNPIFVSLKFEVFDVSKASGFYGPGSG